MAVKQSTVSCWRDEEKVQCVPASHAASFFQEGARRWMTREAIISGL
jgi:hypothetical protein